MKFTFNLKRMLFLLAPLFFMNCSSRSNRLTTQSDRPFDSIPRPSTFSSNSILMNFGGDEIPVYVWADIIGVATINNKKYDHILGVKFSYHGQDRCDTSYYENLVFRKSNKPLDVEKIRLLPSVANSNIDIVYLGDTLTMFYAVNIDDEFSTIWNGVNFSKVSSINTRNDSGIELYNGEVDVSVIRNKKTFDVRIGIGNNDEIFTYKSNNEYVEDNFMISFINKDNGEIYLMDKNVILSPLLPSKVINKLRSY